MGLFSKPEKALSYGTLSLPFPDGRTVECEPLPLKRAYYWLEMWERHVNGDREASKRLIAFFPAETGLRRELEALTPQEFFEVIPCFFSRRGSVSPARANGDERASTGSASPGTTSSPTTPESMEALRTT